MKVIKEENVLFLLKDLNELKLIRKFVHENNCLVIQSDIKIINEEIFD